MVNYGHYNATIGIKCWEGAHVMAMVVAHRNYSGIDSFSKFFFK